jgi:peptide/nickel transport system permease protein
MTTTNKTLKPTGGPVTLPREENWLRPPSRLEKAVGPEWARLIKGIFTNPLSVLGVIIIIGFISVALFAPILAPAPNANWNPYDIPREGFLPQPKPPGTVWEKNVPA